MTDDTVDTSAPTTPPSNSAPDAPQIKPSKLAKAEQAVKNVVKKVEKEIQEDITNAETAAKLDISNLRTILVALGHLAKDDTIKTEQEIIELSGKLVLNYNAVLKNAGVMLVHTLGVYESMVLRSSGVLPDELVKGTEAFKNREGWKDLKTVIDQILPIFNQAPQPTPPAPPEAPKQ